MYKFKVVSVDELPFGELERSSDHTVFKSRAWLGFLQSTQKVTPVAVEITREGDRVGYFIGYRFRKLVSIIAAPFEGWTTSYQGISLFAPVPVTERAAIYGALVSFLFRSGLCVFFQATDWTLPPHALDNSNLSFETVNGYVLDLEQSEEKIYKDFSASSCRYSIRKAEKAGVTIRSAADLQSFAVSYYQQLIDVFAKQGLVPTYSQFRVESLIEHLHRDGKVLLLEAISSEGICIATGIFVGDSNTAFFWGGASYSRYQKLCPNELLMYHAIRHWKAHGVKELEFGGGRNYKEKYGPAPYKRAKIVVGKYKCLMQMKKIAGRAYRAYANDVKPVLTRWRNA